MGRTLNLTHVFFKLVIPRNIVEQEKPGFLFCSAGVTLMIFKVIITVLYLCGIMIKPQPRPILSSQARVENCRWTDLSFRKRGVYKRRRFYYFRYSLQERGQIILKRGVFKKLLFYLFFCERF